MTAMVLHQSYVTQHPLCLHQCFSKWAESPLWGRFWWARGR